MAASKTQPLRTKEDAAKKAPAEGRLVAPGQPNPKSASDKPIVRIGVLLHEVARKRTTIFDQAVREMGITRAQWRALVNLSRRKTEGMNQSDLARALDVGKSTIVGLLDLLTQKGLVERRPHGDDRRVNNIHITQRGYDLIYCMSPLEVILNTVFLAGVDEQDIKITEAVLEKLKQNLDLLIESGPDLKLPKALRSRVEAMKENNR